jgi:hypothetical protein
MGAAFSAVAPEQTKAQSPLVGAAAARLMPIRLTVAETKEQKEVREKEEKEQQAKLKKLGM